MSLETLLIWLLIGAIAGWLAGIIVKGYGFGLVGTLSSAFWALLLAVGFSARSALARATAS